MRAFHEALARGRERYNSLFAQAAVARPIDPAALTHHLTTLVAPAIEAVHRVRPPAVDAVLDALFEASLELVGRGLAGSEGRIPAIDAAWRTLWVAHPGHLAAAPRRVITAISNAVTHLGDGADAWVAAMERAGHVADGVERWLEAGQVLGWTCGLAELRTSALALCRSLPEPLAAVALHLPDLVDVDAACDALTVQPWRSPTVAGARLGHVGRIGAFVGLGGAFREPPDLLVRGGWILATDGHVTLTLHADRYGARLLPSEPPERTATPEPCARMTEDGRASLGNHSAVLPELQGYRRAVGTSTTLAVVLPHSHAIHLVGVTESDGG
ncbi:MAG: hypothetical protein KTR31_30945 [Myxococcales bacterium]|nr:hypothetical protein [Myxococcales bacterium]